MTPTGTTSQGLPSSFPKVISPGENKPIPQGFELIQIGFKFPLNYLFVSSNPVAAAQIAKYLPIALANASSISIDKIQVNKLVAYDSNSTWGYFTTIAMVTYPSKQEEQDKLAMDLRLPQSAIYNNEDPLVRNLTAQINPNIGIHGELTNGGPPGGRIGGGGGGGSNGGANGNGNNNDAFGSGNNDQSSKQKATTAGIAVGALGLSVMYGAAMFIVARRYKRKRQGHRRSSSVTGSQTSSDMQYHSNGSPAMMGGGLLSRDVSTYDGVGGRDSHASGGHSARTANISAPVATENSLGWN